MAESQRVSHGIWPLMVVHGRGWFGHSPFRGSTSKKSVCYYGNRNVYISNTLSLAVHGQCMVHRWTTRTYYTAQDLPILYAACTRRRLPTLYFGIIQFILPNARSHNTLNCSGSVYRAPQSPQSTRPFRPRMEVVGATSAIVGLAIPVFKSAKEVRDRIKLVRYPPHSLRTLRALIVILHPCSQVALEKEELLAALIEYEKDINLLESLYNDNKELLDQYKLDTDLKELAEYAQFYFPLATGSDDGAESYATLTNGSTPSTRTWARRRSLVLKNCGDLEICARNWSHQM